jgi:hypothetical protein
VVCALAVSPDDIDLAVNFRVYSTSTERVYGFNRKVAGFVDTDLAVAAVKSAPPADISHARSNPA